MGRHGGARQLERWVPTAAQRAKPPGSGGPEHRQEALTPVERSVLSLQARAGNAAVVTAIGALAATGRAGPAVQRDPKDKKPAPSPEGKKPAPQPVWVTNAQAALAQLFPKDDLMGHVVIKDYAQLNKTLQGAGYGAWTQSGKEIFLKDPTSQIDPDDPTTKIDPNDPAKKGWPDMMVKYELHHEAVHVDQFTRKKNGGQPKTWQRMLEYELEAYEKDMTWLLGSEAAKLIPVEALMDQLQEGADKNKIKITKLLDDTKKLTGKKREDKLREGMLGLKLLPKGAKDLPDPTPLYQQPP